MSTWPENAANNGASRVNLLRRLYLKSRLFKLSSPSNKPTGSVVKLLPCKTRLSKLDRPWNKPTGRVVKPFRPPRELLPKSRLFKLDSPSNKPSGRVIQGPGIYSLHYCGDLSVYSPIGDGRSPIYVGKAVPPGRAWAGELKVVKKRREAEEKVKEFFARKAA